MRALRFKSKWAWRIVKKAGWHQALEQKRSISALARFAYLAQVPKPNQ
jgi:hypothetical protein